MQRCLEDLCRREVARLGAPGLALLWARTLPELLLTALKERSAMLARDARTLPDSPTSVGRWGTFAALLGGFMGITYYLVWAVREAVGGPMVGYGDSGLSDPADLAVIFAAQLLCVLGLFGVYGAVSARSGRAARRDRRGPRYGLRRLVAGELRASGALFAVAAVCWLAGQLLLGAAAHRRGLALRLRVLPIFAAALWPASFLLLPDNYGLNGTLSDVMPFLGSLLVGSVLLGNAAAGGRSPLTGAGTAVVGMAGRLAGGRGEGAA